MSEKVVRTPRRIAQGAREVAAWRHSFVGPVVPTAGATVALRPLEKGGFRLEGGFWGQRQLLNREVTIPHGITMLEEHGNLENLRMAAARKKGEYRLPLFRDSDVYKVLEAIGWERQHGLAPEQERFFASTAAVLASAQMSDGYLNSFYQVAEPDRRYADPAMGHELYCAGHLLQAAVAEARGPARRAVSAAGEAKHGGAVRGGDGRLWPTAVRVARHLLSAMGERPAFVPGHPQVEMALVEVFRTSGDAAYLELAGELAARRGHSRLEWSSFGPDYFQDDVQLEQAKEIRGHAVRALYLLGGAADLYSETGRPELLATCLGQWEDMVGAKTYLTGGVGSRQEGEAFGKAFELPPESAYCETCAAVASILWNWRMLLITGEARFAELMERTLYNGFLSGWGLDGKTFFYVNPLRSRGGVSRQPWFRCACCPPNIMRLVASLEHYVATGTAAGLQLHQFIPGTFRQGASGRVLAGRVETAYPYDGLLRLQIEEASPGNDEIAIRVPSWVSGAEVGLNGAGMEAQPGPDGYLHLRRDWQPGDELTVSFPIRARVVRPDPRIEDVAGCVAFERGPLVYCWEALGTAASTLEGIAVSARREYTLERRAQIASETVIELVRRGHRASPGVDGHWPYRDVPAAGPDGGVEEVELHAVPYYAWGNRGQGQMRVWVPEL